MDRVGKQTVGLAMIVKDAEDSIRACLDSARPFLDHWTILDTGSTDATKEIVEEVLGGLPGMLYEGEFVDFGTTRSQLMGLAAVAPVTSVRPSDYLMLLDADMQVDHEGDLPELTAAVCEGTVRTGPIDYALPILVRNDRAWRYEGVAHSYLACDQGYEGEVLPGLRIIDGSHTTEAKLRRDLELLSAEHARNPTDARTTFYLAQTYLDLDMIPEAIQTYRTRAEQTGFDEETFYARYRLGALLCEHVSFAAGAEELLAAWRLRPQRIEPLRVLANVASNVADKAPIPDDRLFVGYGHYAKIEVGVPPLPVIAAGERRRPRMTRLKGLRPSEVSAVIVTRGNVDLDPILASIPYEEVVIWDNSKRERDLKAFGRYAAIPETTNPVIYWQDDDVLFTAHDELLAAYRPGQLVCNMDESWVEACGYRGLVGMQGAGSLCDASLPSEVFARYLEEHPWDDDALTEADFIFGVLCPFTVVDIGYSAFDYADGPDRLYTQPWQQERKWKMIERCRELLPVPA